MNAPKPPIASASPAILNKPKLKQTPKSLPQSSGALPHGQMNSTIFTVDLGVSGMRDVTADMVSGGMYGLQVRTSSARFPLLASSLKSALATGLPCTLITGANPETVLQRLQQSGGFATNELLADNRLMVFSSLDEFSKNMFRYGAERLLRELENFGIPERSFLIFDQADELLSLHDLFLAAQQIKVIAAWFKARQITALVTFCRPNEQRMEALNALLDDLSGLAKLGGDKDGIELTFTYWRTSGDVMAAQNFRLYIEKLGTYAVSRRGIERAIPIEAAMHDPIAADEPMLGLADMSFPGPPAFIDVLNPALTPAFEKPLATHQLQQYVYTDVDLDVLTGSVEGKLLRVESLVDVLHACLGNPKSVIVLTLDAITNVKELAKSVHLLRKSLGATSQIIVREKGIAMTAPQKQLFMHSGANAVISRETPIAQYTNFLNAIRNQIFSQEIEPHFDAILARIPQNDELMVVSNVSKTLDHSEVIQRPQAFAYKPAGQITEKQTHKAIEKAKRSSIATIG
jgi:Cellulose biosynthesis GIL